MNDQQWIVVSKVSGEFVAELLRGLLDAQGIPVQLFNKGTGRAFGFSVGPLSEVEILVPESREAEAMQVIEHYEAGDFEPPETET